jgi:MFS transporter, PAT family, beta-lactamase induction signal transducer AmpG
MKAHGNTERNPWLWIPTLYFVEGIPYFLVNNISVLMFARMGVPNGQMSLFTSLLYLPWTLKFLWSPFVDIIRTKRWWILTMQTVMSAAFIVLALTMPHPSAQTIASGTTPMGLFSFTLLLFIFAAFASATHDIAADGFYMLAQSQSSQAAFVGVRSTFYRLANVFGNGVIVAVAGILETRTGDIPLAWQITVGGSGLLLTALTLYHTWAVPRPASDSSDRPKGSTATAGDIFRDFKNTVVTYFRKPGVWLAVVFMLCYRLPEAFLIKLCSPFLVASRETGGLGMATAEVGLAYGTLGVIFLLLGGILGGLMASRVGLKKSIWIMAAFMTLPCFSFVYLAVAQPESFVTICTCIAIEQFGYGFGFTAYMLYMMYFSEGEYKTSHYAFCTCFMALSMMVPGMFAGYLQEWLGYRGFFWMVIVCCLATVAVTLAAYRKIDPEYGKK